MSRKQTLIKGTILLTATGLFTRIMGFFYRIFLSQIFSSAQIGLYQLIFPVYALGFSLTSAGIQLSLSRCTSKYIALNDKQKAKELLYTSIFLTLIFSAGFTLLLQNTAPFIAENYLHNSDTVELLMILSYLFPFSALHSCITGYYLGLQKTLIPAISQFLEQAFRIASVVFFYLLSVKLNTNFSISFAVVGLIIGELTSSLFCVKMFAGKLLHLKLPRLSFCQFVLHAKELLSFSLPVTATRSSINILQSIEAVAIPFSLEQYGLNSSHALSIYGVLTGMALPCILFPSAITNAVSTMLLPAVSEIQTLNDHHALLNLVRKTILSCTALGLFCCLLFLTLGEFSGTYLFHSPLAGKFIVTLSWMCPFLYTNTTITSMINGTGKTTVSFLINVINLCIRIVCVISIIPLYGIYGYLIGLLISQLFSFLSGVLFLYKYFKAEAS